MDARPASTWLRVAVFFAIACAWSWPLFWLRDMHPDGWRAWAVPHPLKMTLLMWGPGVAALVCMRLFRRPALTRSTLGGGAPWRAAAFYILPTLALAALGVQSREFGPGTAHAMLLLVAAVGFVNVLGEELGWRGYLQDTLAHVSPLRRYGLVGLLWVGWHFTNLFASRDGGELLRYLAWYVPLTIALSVLIGEATRRTRALVVAVTLHAWVNLLWEMPGTSTYAVGAAALPFWAWLWWTWPRGDAQAQRLDGAPAPVQPR